MRAQCAKNARLLDFDPSSSCSIVRPVFRTAFNYKVLRILPSCSNEHFLVTPGPMQFVSKKFRDEHNETAFRLAFEPDSIIHATVVGLDFDFLNALLATLNDVQIDRINIQKVKLIVRLNRVDRPGGLNVKSVAAFNTILLEKFQLTQSAARSSSDDDLRPDNANLAGCNIKFEHLPFDDEDREQHWFNLSKLADTLDRYSIQHSEVCVFIQPFFLQWYKEHGLRHTLHNFVDSYRARTPCEGFLV